MKKLIGSKDFYKYVLGIAFPIMLQNGISNFVNMLDNIMVGRVGTEQMSGVSIVNQLIFIFYLCIFGAISGAGIFTAQFYGQKNMKGVRETFRFKLVICAVILAIACAVLWFFRDPLIGLYLHDGSQSGDLNATLMYGKQYLAIMLIGLIPFAVESAYSSTLRETGETVIPMRASVVAVLVNMVLNYILIFGKFGAPKLGVEGAAIATVVSRYVQMSMVVVWTHKHTEKYPYVTGLYKHFEIPKSIVKQVTVTGFPLLLNEGLWAAGVATQTQCFSVRGLAVVAALNINSTIFNVFNIVFIALGDAVAIIVGQQLGSGDHEKAKDTAYKIIAFSVAVCVVCGGLLALVGPFFPRIYNTEQEVKDLAGWFIRITGFVMPIGGYLHPAYFTIRSGGKTMITFLFDSVFLWVVAVPIAYALSSHTQLSIVTVFLCVQLADLIKVIIGALILRSGVWMNTLVAKDA